MRKQINKQINIILDPKYLSQIKPDIYETFRETSCGCPKMIKKYINISQPKSDLYEIFRVYSCGCSKMIKIKKQVNKQTNKQTNKQINMF